MLSHYVQESGVTGGWLALAALGLAVVAYFLGCFNGAVVVSRYILRNDVRNHGSGNGGLTNFYRTFGGPLTAVVILSDVVKAVLAVLFGVLIANMISPVLVPVAKYWTGMFCLLGHMFPCTFQFRGGKGILSGGTIAFMLDWRVALVVWGGFLIGHHQICVPGLLLGGAVLPLCVRLCLPGYPDYPDCHCAGRTHSVEAPGEHPAHCPGQ